MQQELRTDGEDPGASSPVPMPTTFRGMIRRFLQQPAGNRKRLLVGLLIGRIRSNLFSEAHWPILERGASLRRGNGRISVGRFAKFERGCQVAVHAPEGTPAYFRVGQRSAIGPQTIINVAQHVEIGDRCLIAWNCEIMDTDFHRIEYAPEESPRPITSPVKIGHDVWIGARCIILKGVVIGDNSVIGSGSVVTSDIPANSLAVGNPARVVRQIVGWTR